MQTPEVTPGSSPNRTPIVVGVTLVVLCICCAVIAAGYYGYQAYLKARQTAKDFENIQIPTDMPSYPNGTDLPSMPTIPGVNLGNLGETPSGGKADDTTRYTAWAAVQVVAMMSDCMAPAAKTTTIKLAQEPDANGVWKEEWNVDCGNGSSKAYTITFTPENGVVNVNVEIP